MVKKNIRKTVFLLFLVGLFIISIASPAQSDDLFWTGSLYNGAGGTIENIRTLDWSSSGSGLAKGVASLGTISPGTSFDFLYQSYLTGITTANGGFIPFAGLNQNFEYTMVAEVHETVYSTLPYGPLVTYLFQTTGGRFFIYYDDNTLKSNVSSGFGFDDGKLVASGTIPAGQISAFTFNTTNKTGLGSTIINGPVDYVNPAYLRDTSGLDIIGFRFEGSINYPPTDSKTSAFFDGRAGEGFLSTYSVTNKDLLFKVDGSGSFVVTPEPVSSVLFITGGAMLIIRYYRKKKQNNL